MDIDQKTVPLSPARRAGDFLYLSGQIAFDSNGRMTGDDVATQTHQVFRNIKAVLADNGARVRRHRQRNRLACRS
ncbi:MAG: RidA family protein [Proteobacteria bacterium]|nr:RidA family protein [Pseudomonadota bacterium]